MTGNLVATDAPLAMSDPWRAAIALATDGQSPNTARAYGQGISRFLAWRDANGAPPVSKATVSAWKASLLAESLSPATVNLYLAAVKALVTQGADNGHVPEPTAAAVRRVPGVPRRGVRAGRWLSVQQAQALLRAPDLGTLGGLRDRALVALMVGAGLRREECARLDVAHIRQVDGVWAVVDLEGKHGRVRTVPLASWTCVAVSAWTAAAGITEGRILRPVNKGGRLAGDGLTASAVWYCLRRLAARLAKADPAGPWHAIAPHDLRRTYAQLARKGGAALEQISLTLGHASLSTTERYLGGRLDVHSAPAARLGLTL